MAQMNRVPVREQEPKVRARNFEEVCLGYNEEEAIAEAKRCLTCKKPRCVGGCPVSIDIPAFIARVKEADFAGAYQILSASSALPAVCGRVCPQETQCEGQCVLGVKGESVAIGKLERFVADWAREHGIMPEGAAEKNGHRVAVIGCGPAGITCAGDLARMGYSVKLFEALHEAGGVLVYGIPEFRLPKETVVKHEIDNLRHLGVEIETNVIIGRSVTIDQLMEDNLGVKALGWTWNGFRNMDTKDPITSVADCKVYKLRSPGADIYMDTFKTLGMAPEPISWSECYTAMQSGVVDGVESGLEAFYTQGFYALGNNICLSRHMLSIIGPVINVEKWNSLNEKTQQLLLDTWAKYQAELDATVIAGEESYQEKLEAEGCNITSFEDRQELIDLFTPYWSKNAEAGGYTELLNQTLELIAG